MAINITSRNSYSTGLMHNMDIYEQEYSQWKQIKVVHLHKDINHIYQIIRNILQNPSLFPDKNGDLELIGSNQGLYNEFKDANVLRMRFAPIKSVVFSLLSRLKKDQLSEILKNNSYSEKQEFIQGYERISSSNEDKLKQTIVNLIDSNELDLAIYAFRLLSLDTQETYFDTVWGKIKKLDYRIAMDFASGSPMLTYKVLSQKHGEKISNNNATDPLPSQLDQNHILDALTNANQGKESAIETVKKIQDSVQRRSAMEGIACIFANNGKGELAIKALKAVEKDNRMSRDAIYEKVANLLSIKKYAKEAANLIKNKDDRKRVLARIDSKK